ncbi:iron complex transport system ATP-binding protein [Martelella radicis]|uniref:Iron complex transport system ATP-binding protein n=2 Tax=Martelella radicis TaxID=1397476 RepID=A0A7W6KKQ0_9HYPH|nr:iron complex transport system ATP-binding protein [Martelella radicis]
MLLSVDNLTVRIGGRAIIDNVGFSVGHGELVGLIGPNGAGKTTLLKACLGLTRASGNVHVMDTPLARMTPLQRARAIAYLPQEHEIAWAVAVRHVVGLGRQPWRECSAFGDYAGGQIIARAMERMGVDTLADRRADTLSGGERARVLIARTLAQATPLLVADEPVAGLDPAHQIALMEVFGSLLREGRSVVCSLHDLGLAARWCTRLVMLAQGHIIADGPPSSVLTPQNLRQVYGVEAFFGHANGGPVVMPTGLSEK